MLRRLPILLAFLVAARALAPSLGYLAALERHVEYVARWLEKTCPELDSGGEAEAVRFSFSKTEKASIRWVKKGREFVRDGQLFDVEKVETRGDSLIVFAYFDKLESDLHDAFSAQKKSDEHDFSKAAWAAFHGSPMEILEPDFFHFYIALIEKRLIFYQKKVVSAFSKNTSPPPKSRFFS